VAVIEPHTPLVKGEPELLPSALPVLVTLGQRKDAALWLSSLPSLIEQVRRQWQLRLSAPLHAGSCSWVAPAELPDGARVIVKIGWPHREMRGEPAALEAWAGGPAVRLLANDPVRHALLLERCEPGSPLMTAVLPAEQRLSAGCEVLRELWAARVPKGDAFETLPSVAAEWADLVDERMDRLRPGYDPGLVAEGCRLLRTLPRTATRTTLLHGDFNPGNILSAQRRPWLAIDPKPMVGDPAYDPWPLLEQVDDPFGYPRPAPVLKDRVRLLAEELDLDPARIIAWAVARRVETALWAAQQSDVAGGASIMDEAQTLANL
jgi:streptomycin 6-kinase